VLCCYSSALRRNVIESVSSPGHLLAAKIPRSRGLKMKAGCLLWRQAYFWSRAWNEKGAETRREEIREGILKRWHHWSHSAWAPRFISAVCNGWTLLESKLKRVASWKKQHFYYPSNKVCSEGFTLCPCFALQGEGISCRAVVSNTELWVRCSFTGLRKIGL